MADVDWNPDTYLAEMLAEVPGYDELEAAVAAAAAGIEANTVLELGTGTGETALRVLGGRLDRHRLQRGNARPRA